jgi:hypothetical protein
MTGCATYQGSSEMKLDQLIQTIDAAYPYSLKSVEELFGRKLETKDDADAPLRTYQAENLKSKNGIEIKTISLGLWKGESTGSLGIEFPDAEIPLSLEQFRQKFPKRKILQMPLGEALGEPFVYSIKGTIVPAINFSFRFDNQEHLTKLLFAKPRPEDSQKSTYDPDAPENRPDPNEPFLGF